MSALLMDLEQHGVTTEDLEKAAAVRLFEKTAAANDIDLNQMGEVEQDQLFDHFLENVLPDMIQGDGSQSDPQDTGKTAQVDVNFVMAKVAGLNDDTKIAAFEEAAKAEDIDLTKLSEEELQGAYGFFLENVLPDMVANEIYKAAEAPESTDKVAEAQAKLAEADILGRHMARSFWDESQKLASMAQAREALKNLGGAIRGARKSPRFAAEAAKESLKSLATSTPGKVTGGTLLAGGSFVGGRASKGGEKEDSKNASAPIFEALALEKAAEILEANGIDPQTGKEAEVTLDDAVTTRAVEILEANGFSFEQ